MFINEKNNAQKENIFKSGFFLGGGGAVEREGKGVHFTQIVIKISKIIISISHSILLEYFDTVRLINIIFLLEFLPSDNSLFLDHINIIYNYLSYLALFDVF